MKTKIAMLCMTAGLLLNCNAEVLDNKSIIITDNTHIKGVLFQDIGIRVEPDSQLEKDLINVLIKHKQVSKLENNMYDKTLENINNTQLNIKSNEPTTELNIKKVNDTPVIEKTTTYKEQEQNNLMVADEMALDLRRCTYCHGSDFSRSADNKSKIVSDLSKEDVLKALKGYKIGYYGGDSKNVMKEQLKSYSNSDLEIIANQIARKDFQVNKQDQ